MGSGGPGFSMEYASPPAQNRQSPCCMDEVVPCLDEGVVDQVRDR